MEKHYDVLVIGSGAAGLTLALSLPKHLTVGVISKGRLNHANSTYWAQGGISAVLDQEDTFDAHIADTLNAGAGLCEIEAVAQTVNNAPQIINWLIELGMPFTKDSQQQYHLTQEGGHSHRRVIHAQDATGKALQMTLSNHAQQAANIELLEHMIAVDIICSEQLPKTACGAYVLDIKQDRVLTISAVNTVLATGGANKVYLYSTNPNASSGDGIAMAWRAGCKVANMEFMQFHPTCLYHPGAKSFLISEALRGEGGILRLPNGEAFMHKYDPRENLAPRDITARAIDFEMKKLGIDCVYLDISHKSSAFIRSHFPTIYQRCLELGIAIDKQPIPVVPAAHYTCGGVVTNLNGQTDIDNLYAIGETTYTGLHGANRMASNSLLECMIFAKKAAASIAKGAAPKKIPKLKGWDESQVTDADENVMINHNWQEIRRTMWNYVGIVRSNKRLQRADNRLNMLLAEINEFYGHFRVSHHLLELRNLCTVAKLIVLSAQMRQESRGLHYTLDYPQQIDDSQASILDPQQIKFG